MSIKLNGVEKEVETGWGVADKEKTIGWPRKPRSPLGERDSYLKKLEAREAGVWGQGSYPSLRFLT